MIDKNEDKRKFVVLYEQYRYLMMQVAYNVLFDYYFAEDAVQNALNELEDSSYEAYKGNG